MTEKEKTTKVCMPYRLKEKRVYKEYTAAKMKSIKNPKGEVIKVAPEWYEVLIKRDKYSKA